MGGPGSGRRPRVDVEAERAAAKKPTTRVSTGTTARRARKVKHLVSQHTGGSFEVLTPEEKVFYEGQSAKYLEDFSFSASSDLADLDRLLFQELMDFRWSRQLASGQDYDRNALLPGMEEQLRRNKTEGAKLIGQIKSDLGMNQSSRDLAKESPAAYVQGLLRRAGEFGVHRNNQVIKALTLMNQLSSIVGTFDRSNELERSKTGFESEEDIVEWVRSEMLPEFRAVDDAWRKSTQKYWEGM